MEEYGIETVPVDEAYTSSTCPLHAPGCGKRIHRGLYKCTTIDKVFNADVVAAYNIPARGVSITPSPRMRVGVTGRRPGPGLNKKDVAPNLPALPAPRTLTL